jgi:hypothetical protein
MDKIFISYRRHDCRHLADRLYESLQPHFDVFMDVDIAPATVFPEVLQRNLEECKLLLAVIGPQWLTIADASGRRRLEDVNDYVRREIESALQQDKPILPLLADGTPMPPADELPPSLRPLVNFQAVRVRPNPDFASDTDQLIRAVEEQGVCRKPPPFPERLMLPPKTYAAMYPHWREGVWYVAFFWALVAAALGGLLANFVLPLLLDSPEAQPHGRAALAWPLLNMLPIFLVLYLFNVRLRLLDPWLQGGLFAGFLSGETLASWLYYDLPGPGLLGVRQILHSLHPPFAVEELVLVVTWSGLLAGLGFLGLAVAAGVSRFTRDKAGPIPWLMLARQAALCVAVTTVIVMVLVFVFPLGGHASARGFVAGLVLRVMLFFGILSAAEGVSGGRRRVAASSKVSPTP